MNKKTHNIRRELACSTRGYTVLLVLLAVLLSACDSEINAGNTPSSGENHLQETLILKSITPVDNDGSIRLQYIEPKDKDFTHIEITATPVDDLKALTVTYRVLKGVSSGDIVLQGLTQKSKYRVSVMAVYGERKSKAVEKKIDISEDSTAPHKNGMGRISTTIKKDAIVFTWDTPTDRSIHHLEIAIEDLSTNTVEKKEVPRSVLMEEKTIEMPAYNKDKEYRITFSYRDNNDNWVKDPDIALHQETIKWKTVDGLAVNVNKPETLEITWESPAQTSNMHVVLDIREKNGKAVGLIHPDGTVIPFVLKGAEAGTSGAMAGESPKKLVLTAADYGIVGAKAYEVIAKVYDTTKHISYKSEPIESGQMMDTVVSTDLKAEEVGLIGVQDGENNKLKVMWKAPEIAPTAIQAYLESQGKSTANAKAMATRELPDFARVKLLLFEDGNDNPIAEQEIEKGIYTHTFDHNMYTAHGYTVKVILLDRMNNPSTGVEKDTGDVTFAKRIPTAPKSGNALEAKPLGYIELRWGIAAADGDIKNIHITPTVNGVAQPVVLIDAHLLSHRLGPYNHGDKVQFSLRAVDIGGQESVSLKIPKTDANPNVYTIDAQAPSPQLPEVSTGDIVGTFQVSWTPQAAGDQATFRIYAKNTMEVLGTFSDTATKAHRKNTFTVIPSANPTPIQLEAANAKQVNIRAGEWYKVTLSIEDESGNSEAAKETEVQAKDGSVKPGVAHHVRIKAGTQRIDKFVVAWTAPANFGKDVKGVNVVEKRKIQYTVYYIEKKGDAVYTPQMILNDDAHGTSAIIAGDTSPLEVALTALRAHTTYAISVETKNTDDSSKVSYSAVVELKTLGKTLIGSLTYDTLRITHTVNRYQTVLPTGGGIHTANVQYTIVRTRGLESHTGLMIDNRGEIILLKELPIGISEHTITVTKAGYESKTAILRVEIDFITMKPPLYYINQRKLTKKKRNTFTVRWSNGRMMGTKVIGRYNIFPLFSDEIPYKIHYAWQPLDTPTARYSLAEIKQISTYKTLTINASTSLPRSITVNEYIGFAQRVYVYVEAINS